MSCGRLQEHTLHNLLNFLAAEVGSVDVTLLLGQLAEEDLQASRKDEIAKDCLCALPTSACRAICCQVTHRGIREPSTCSPAALVVGSNSWRQALPPGQADCRGSGDDRRQSWHPGTQAASAGIEVGKVCILPQQLPALFSEAAGH